MEWQTALLLAFALSFSSTVFAVKSLNESGDMGAMHGRVAIDMLIMQDILAVLFLTFSTGKIPCIWAIALLAALLFGRKWLGALTIHGLLWALFLMLLLPLKSLAIFGMGRMGLAAYQKLGERFPGQVIGFDRDPAAVELHRLADRNVLLADATDSDFWERVSVRDKIDLVVLAMPKHTSNVQAAKTLKRHNFEGVVTATGKFDDEVNMAPQPEDCRGRRFGHLTPGKPSFLAAAQPKHSILTR